MSRPSNQIERAGRLNASEITAIKVKTDFITVTSNTNLDSIRTSVDATPVGLSGYEARIAALEAIVIDLTARIVVLETP